MSRWLLLLGIALNAPAFGALNQDPELHWRTLYSEHFAIHFHDGEEALARRAAGIAERVHAKLSPWLDWQPKDRTQVVLSDRFDYSNGFATPFPRNTMSLIVTPPNGSSVLGDYDDWLALLIEHEYTHILHLDKATGLPSDLRQVFGRFPLLFPALFQPPWVHEGLATYMETDTARGIGRGQNSLFRMLMRLEVAHGIKPLRQANQPLESWPMNTVRYLYGVYFFQFLRDRYGEAKIQELLARYSDNLIPFMINTNSRQVLGHDLDELWQEFTAYLQQDFGPELEDIRRRGEVSGRQLSQDGYFTGRAQVAANGDLYYLRNDLQSEPQLMLIRAGQTQATPVAEVRGSSFDLHPQAGIVVAEQDRVHNTNVYSDLYHVDPATGRKTRLTTGGRYLYASWSPDGTRLVAVHNDAGNSALQLLDTNGKLLDTLWQGNDLSVIGAPDWSPDGRSIAAAVWRPDSRWNLELFDLQSRHWHRLSHDQNIETEPRFSADGSALLFSADYGRVFNLQRLELATGKLTTLSNVPGGAFAPAPEPNGAGVYYMGANGQGYDLYYLATPATNTPVPETRPTAQPEAPADPSQRIEDYNALPRIAPTAWFPYFGSENSANELGFSTWGSDPLQRHYYNLLLGLDPDNHWLVGRLDYVYDRWNPTLKLAFDRQIYPLRNTSNDILQYRVDDLASLEALWPLFRYRDNWTLHAGLVAERIADQKLLAGGSPRPTLRDQLLGLAVDFNSVERYARSISPSNGRLLRLIAEDDDLLASDASGQTYILDWREFLDLPGQHVLAARLVGGWGTDNPFPFRLGGSISAERASDPSLDAQTLTEAIFGRRQYALRGYPSGLADLTGRRMVLVDLEWRFPIALIERGFMAPPVGIHKLYGALFHNWGEAWDSGSQPPAMKRGAGAELNTELVLGYQLLLKLRLGYARGFDTGGEDQLYLELGGSF